MIVPPIRSERDVFPAANRCIYCGREDVDLRLEHIIPEALDGRLELPKASCIPCADIINRYEHVIGRSMFGDFRIRHNIRSKRPKKERPTTIDVATLAPDGSLGDRLTVSRTEFPAPLFMYKFSRAAILQGIPPGVRPLDREGYIIHDTTVTTAFGKKYGRTAYRIRLVPVEFVRMLAKIGYSYAVAVLGIEAFDVLPQTLDTILLRTEDVGFTVGGEKVIKPPNPNAGHLLALQYGVTPTREMLVIVHIRLFASLNTPNFHVVVGRVDFKNPQHVASLRKELPNAQTVKPF